MTLNQYRRFTGKESISRYGKLNPYQRNCILLSDNHITKFITLSFAETGEISQIELIRLVGQLRSILVNYIIKHHGASKVYSINKHKIPAISSVEYHQDEKLHIHIGTTSFSTSRSIDRLATSYLKRTLNVLLRSEQFKMENNIFNTAGNITANKYLNLSKKTLIDYDIKEVDQLMLSSDDYGTFHLPPNIF